MLHIGKLWPLYVAIFIAFVGFSVQLPIFTSMMLDPSHGFADDWTNTSRKIFLGLLLGLYPLGQFFGSPLLGAFSDRLGRKPVLIASFFLLVVCYIFISLSLMYHWIYALIPLLFIAGHFDGNIAISQGSITDVTQRADRGKYFGYVYACSATAFIIGPLLSSLFSGFGIAATFWVITILLVFVIVCLVMYYHETLLIEERKHLKLSFPFVNISYIFRDRTIRYFYAVNFMIYLSIFGFLRVYALYVEDMYHIGIIMLSLVIAYVSIPFIIMNLIAVPLISKSRWYNPQTLTMWFSWLMGLFMIVVVVPERFRDLWFTLFITTATLALAMTYSTVTLSLHASPEQQGAVMGNNQSLLSIAQALSAFFAGALSAIAIRLPLIIFGLLGLAAGTMLLRKKS